MNRVVLNIYAEFVLCLLFVYSFALCSKVHVRFHCKENGLLNQNSISQFNSLFKANIKTMDNKDREALKSVSVNERIQAFLNMATGKKVSNVVKTKPQSSLQLIDGTKHRLEVEEMSMKSEESDSLKPPMKEEISVIKKETETEQGQRECTPPVSEDQEWTNTAGIAAIQVDKIAAEPIFGFPIEAYEQLRLNSDGAQSQCIPHVDERNEQLGMSNDDSIGTINEENKSIGPDEEPDIISYASLKKEQSTENGEQSEAIRNESIVLGQPVGKETNKIAEDNDEIGMAPMASINPFDIEAGLEEVSDALSLEEIASLSSNEVQSEGNEMEEEQSNENDFSSLSLSDHKIESLFIKGDDVTRNKDMLSTDDVSSNISNGNTGKMSPSTLLISSHNEDNVPDKRALNYSVMGDAPNPVIEFLTEMNSLMDTSAGEEQWDDTPLFQVPNMQWEIENIEDSGDEMDEMDEVDRVDDDDMPMINQMTQQDEDSSSLEDLDVMEHPSSTSLGEDHPNSRRSLDTSTKGTDSENYSVHEGRDKQLQDYGNTENSVAKIIAVAKSWSSQNERIGNAFRGKYRDYMRQGHPTDRLRKNILELPLRKMPYRQHSQYHPQSGSKHHSHFPPKVYNAEMPLIRRFNVIKYNPKKRIVSRKTRTWEIDFLQGLMLNIDRRGKPRKIHSTENLLLVEKYAHDNKRLVISFIGTRHSYELCFKSAVECDEFYELALAIRPVGLMWCPELCPRENEKCTVTIETHVDTSTKSVYLGRKSVIGRRSLIPKSQLVERVQGRARINVSNNGTERIQVFCGTWNLGSAPPPDDFENMEDFIRPGYDIYALSFQECGSSDDNISRYVQRYLGDKYITIDSLVLWAIRMIVLVKEKHVAKISCVETGQRATGFLNICGNKGGLCVTFKFNETRLCFIGCHLAAREERIEQRNTNVYEICDDIGVGYRELDPSQYDYCFWMGDVNYRVDLPFDDGVKLANQKRYDKLLDNDQLLRLMKQGVVFHGFQEGKINFAPSYRYNVGDRQFSREKSRTPSYCDRVLYRALPLNYIVQERYDSPSSITTSDHSPVYATFTIDTRLRYLSLFSQPVPQLIIRFSNVYVSGRSGSLISKPRLSFFASWTETVQVTSGKTKKTVPMVNPRIADKSLPVLRPLVSHRTFLQHQHLFIALRDQGLGKDSRENMIGYGALSLWDAVNSNRPVNFAIELSNKVSVMR